MLGYFLGRPRMLFNIFHNHAINNAKMALEKLKNKLYVFVFIPGAHKFGFTIFLPLNV